MILVIMALDRTVTSVPACDADTLTSSVALEVGVIDEGCCTGTYREKLLSTVTSWQWTDVAGEMKQVVQHRSNVA